MNIFIKLLAGARGFARIEILLKKIYYIIWQAVCFSGHWQKCFISNEQLQFAGSKDIKKIGRPSCLNEDRIALNLLQSTLLVTEIFTCKIINSK